MALLPGEVVVRVIGSALGAHPGAEIVGTVTLAGEAAADWVGRQVLVPRLLPCGECALCQRGRVAVCPHLRRRPAPPDLVPEEGVPSRFLLPLGPPILTEPLPPERLWLLACAAPDRAPGNCAWCWAAGSAPPPRSF